LDPFLTLFLKGRGNAILSWNHWRKKEAAKNKSKSQNRNKTSQTDLDHFLFGLVWYFIKYISERVILTNKEKKKKKKTQCG
jgi:hypothetical protein